MSGAVVSRTIRSGVAAVIMTIGNSIAIITERIENSGAFVVVRLSGVVIIRRVCRACEKK